MNVIMLSVVDVSLWRQFVVLSFSLPSDTNGVAKIIDTPVSIMQYNSTASQTAASKGIMKFN